MDKLIDFLMSAGLEVPVNALAILIITGLIKIPIKRLAAKAHRPSKITRFITLLPVILGFGLTVFFMFIESGRVCFSDGFYNAWLSSVSLSLAIYAVWEKFVPSEKKILSEAEIKANKTVIEEIADKLFEKQNFCEANAVKTIEEKLTKNNFI